MARTTKQNSEDAKVGATNNVEETASKEVTVSKHIEELLKHYPQYKKAWVTKNGFVHAENAPKYLIEDAILYDNKFYKPINS